MRKAFLLTEHGCQCAKYKKKTTADELSPACEVKLCFVQQTGRRRRRACNRKTVTSRNEQH